MSLFKSGDPVFDRLNKYSTEQLLHIVNSTNASNSADVVNAARQILAARGYDSPNLEQNDDTNRQTVTPLLRPRPEPPSGETTFKPWHVILVILFIVRLIACLARHN